MRRLLHRLAPAWWSLGLLAVAAAFYLPEWVGEGAGMKLASPWFLLGLFAVPLVIAAGLLESRTAGRLRFPLAGPLAAIGPTWRTFLVPVSVGLRATAVTLLAVALARPQDSTQPDETELKGIDMVLVLDVSMSMKATDLEPTRLDASKAVVQDFIKRRKNDRIGAVIFAENAYTLCPAYQPTVNYFVRQVKRFIRDWGYEGLKIDGQHLNGVTPCYNPAHRHARPEESTEGLAQFWKAVYEAAHKANHNAVIELCPCGTAFAFHNLPYVDQYPASDPRSSYQVRTKGKTMKALMGQGSSYAGDHVELSDGGGRLRVQLRRGSRPVDQVHLPGGRPGRPARAHSGERGSLAQMGELVQDKHAVHRRVPGRVVRHRFRQARGACRGQGRDSALRLLRRPMGRDSRVARSGPGQVPLDRPVRRRLPRHRRCQAQHGEAGLRAVPAPRGRAHRLT